MHNTVGPADLMTQKQHEEVNKQRHLQLLLHWQPCWNVNLELSKFPRSFQAEIPPTGCVSDDVASLEV